MAKTLSTMLDLGSKATSFALPDTNAHTQDNTALASFSFTATANSSEINADSPKGYLLAFICNHCPFVVHMGEPLADLMNSAQASGLKVAAISANDVANYPADSPEKMTSFAKQYGYEFPYLYDEDQSVAKAYTAACTPDFFLFDAEGELVYRGQFDDSRPGNGVEVTGSDLNAAVTQLLNGTPISQDQKASMGCNIKWKSDNSAAYFG